MQALTSQQRAMVEHSLHIARRAAEARMRGVRRAGRYDWDEIYAAACYGLVHAATRRDPARPFEAYAQACCHGAISEDEKQSYFTGSRSRRRVAHRVSLDDLTSDDDGPLGAAIRSEAVDRVRHAMTALTPLQRTVIARRAQGETYHAIGASSGVGRTSAMKCEWRAHAQLRKSLASLA